MPHVPFEHLFTLFGSGGEYWVVTKIFSLWLHTTLLMIIWLWIVLFIIVFCFWLCRSHVIINISYWDVWLLEQCHTHILPWCLESDSSICICAGLGLVKAVFVCVGGECVTVVWVYVCVCIRVWVCVCIAGVYMCLCMCGTVEEVVFFSCIHSEVDQQGKKGFIFPPYIQTVCEQS